MIPLSRSPARSVAPALAFSLLLASCGGDSVVGVEGGNVRFVLSAGTTVAADLRSDMPAPQVAGGDAITIQSDGEHDRYERDYHYFESANVTFASVLARNLDGVLENVEMELPVTVDVITMDSGREVVLPEGSLPAATYDQVVVVMTAFQGVTREGTTITVEPGGGGWTAIVPICPFEVGEGETTTVAIQFMLRDAFKWRDGRFFFEPRFRCETDDDEDPEAS